MEKDPFAAIQAIEDLQAFYAEVKMRLPHMDTPTLCRFLGKVLGYFGGSLSHEVLLLAGERLLDFSIDNWKYLVRSFSYNPLLAQESLYYFFLFYCNGGPHFAFLDAIGLEYQDFMQEGETSKKPWGKDREAMYERNALQAQKLGMDPECLQRIGQICHQWKEA